jgi:hypothetical protein
MALSEGASQQAERERRIFFWFVCSALGGVCAREMLPHTAEQIVAETFKIAESMTEHWLANYGVEEAAGE